MKRRNFLVGATAGVAIVGFDPIRKTWLTAAQAGTPGTITIPNLDGQLLTDAATLAAAADDFGHIIHRTPTAVLQPGSAADVQKMVQYANRYGLKVAMRGQGHSTYGQAQVDAGVVIDSQTLNTIHSITPTHAVVDAGVQLLDLLTATIAQGYTPKVFPDYLGLSVGGVLQVGGIGGHTQRFGLFADNVFSLNAVTGAGNTITCSASQNPGLLNGLTGSLGQFSLITQATLPLIPAPTNARVFQLSYTRLADYLADQSTALLSGRFSFLEGQVVPNPAGTGWTYLLEAASYYTPPQSPDNTALLSGLTPDAGTTITEYSYFDWQNRLAPVVAFLQAQGLWDFPHPWLNLFLPQSQVAGYLSSVLASLLPTDVNGPVLLYPFRRSRLTRPFIETPNEEVLFIFSILRTSPPDAAIANALVSANRVLFDQARNLGGKSYRIDSLPFSFQDWRQHFGNDWGAFRSLKAQLDPRNVLTPGQGIFSHP